jgi:RHS repeat-associated protein
VDHIVFAHNGTNVMTTSNKFDNLNRLTGISSASSVVNSQYQYNAAGQRTRVTLVDGSHWFYAYDALGQVTNAVKYFSDGKPYAGQQYGYGFDTIGNRLFTQAGGNTNGTNLRTAMYTNNALNQITSRDVPGYVDVMGLTLATNTVQVNATNASQKWQYFWEQIGTNNNSAPQWVRINVTATNQTTVMGSVFLARTPETNFTYDLDGNQTSDGRFNYTWDSENRIIAVASLPGTPVASQYSNVFAYDYMGRRVLKIVSTNSGSAWVASYTNQYLYDGWNLMMILGSPMLNANGSVNTNSLSYAFTWGTDLSGSMQGAGGVGGLLSMTVCTGTNAGTYFYCYDGNGNVVALVNAANGTVAANYEYGPFGELIRATGPMAKLNSFMFSSKFYDWETGLYYYGYRYYNPSTGRFINRDPIAEAGELNPYNFVGNDGIDLVDIIGLFTGKYHKSITENALKDSVLAKKCIDTIVKADVGQDDGALTDSGPFSNPLNHGDNNQIKPTIDLIKQRLDAMMAKQCVNCKDVDEVLKLFGMVAHALQDLYAHSTYVENFGKDAKKPSDVPIWQFWNPDGSVNVPTGVITGTYKWPRDNAPYPSHALLNKDDPDTSEGKKKNNNGLTWFSLAEDTATRHTTAAWSDITSKLTAEQKKKLAECCKK